MWAACSWLPKIGGLDSAAAFIFISEILDATFQILHHGLLLAASRRLRSQSSFYTEVVVLSQFQIPHAFALIF